MLGVNDRFRLSTSQKATLFISRAAASLHSVEWSSVMGGQGSLTCTNLLEIMGLHVNMYH